MAGVDWMSAFLDRNHDITMPTTEATSIQRAVGFNRVKVAVFYDCLFSIIFSDNARFIPPSQIYNADESGYTVCRKPTKVLTTKAKKGVSGITSGEWQTCDSRCLYISH